MELATDLACVISLRVGINAEGKLKSLSGELKCCFVRGFAGYNYGSGYFYGPVI